MKEVLEKEYEYFNSEFLDSLKHLDFSVVENAKSNYQYTVISMNSIFNGEYLQYAHGEESFTNEGYKQTLLGIESNRTAATFEKLGYEIANYSPFYFYGIPPFYKNQLLPTDEMLILFPSMYDDFYNLFLAYTAKILNSRSMIKQIYENKAAKNKEVMQKGLLIGEVYKSKPIFC